MISTGYRITGLSAVTLATHDMARAVAFYRKLRLELLKGGPDAAFTTFALGGQYLNLTAEQPKCEPRWWGRAIIHVSDVDAVYDQAIAEGLQPHFPPRDAPWDERYFHLTDPDGHEISFARPLQADRPPRESG